MLLGLIRVAKNVYFCIPIPVHIQVSIKSVLIKQTNRDYLVVELKVHQISQ